ncbi:hypothetical protein Vadar_032467 [Vaccinium darrowii]|uniref:Uncharacterized protein n=1 Tax=Vaccinium darrowii TaxID=229202 RepID=A0ACB7ZFY7_9ERIC|nr:hypothetical protein Vadar_032467 [Vaccinium darrowii]
MAPKDLYLYAHSFSQVVRLNLSKLRDGDCQFELLRQYLRDMECPACMGLMRVNSKLYMFGGFFSGNGEPCLGAYRVDLTNEGKPLVPDVSVPKFVAPKLSPTVVTIEGKTYVFAIPSFAPSGRRFEVFDHSTLNWKPMEDPPLLETEDVEDFYHYFAWGHKILIHNCIRFSIFDTKKLIWEDGDSFFRRWVNDGRPLPTGTAAEIEEGLYIAMSLHHDAVVVYECDPDDGLLRSHQVLEDFSDLISREVVPGEGRGCVAAMGDGWFCVLLCGGAFGRRTETSFGEYAARLATFQASPSVPGRLPVHIQSLECFDVKNDQEFPLGSIVVMPDWSKKRADDYPEINDASSSSKKSKSMVPI